MKKKLQSIQLKIIAQFMLVLCPHISCLGQIKFPNPSFEDTTSCLCYDTPPQPYYYYCAKYWDNCRFSPDPTTYSKDSIIHPSDGNFYMGIWCAMDSYLRESISTKLPCKLYRGIKYSFNIDLRDSYASPLKGIVEIYGSNEICKRDKLLCFSRPTTDTNWQTQKLSFIPDDDINYITISGRPIVDSVVPLYSYLLFDNLSPLFIDTFFTLPIIKVISTLNTNNTQLTPNFTEGTANEYSIRWYKNDGATISNNYTITVNPFQTTTYHVWAKDSCNYNSTDSIVVEPIPTNTMYYDATNKTLGLRYFIIEDASFEFNNILGQPEQCITLDKSQTYTSIQLYTYPAGIYLAFLKNEKGKILWSQKILIYNL